MDKIQNYIYLFIITTYDLVYMETGKDQKNDYI